MSDKCKEMIWGDYRRYQCSNKAKKDGYCGTHHPDAKAKRAAKSEAIWKEKQANSTSAKLKNADDTIATLEQRIKELEGSGWISVIDHGWPEIEGLYVIGLVDFGPVVDEFKNGEFIDHPFEIITRYICLPSPSKDKS